MKWRSAPKISEAFVERFRSMTATNLSREQVIQQMRLSGLSVVQSMKLFQKLYGVSHAEAKTVVHFSPTWADRRESHETLHDIACEAIHELGVEDGEPAKASI